MRVAGFVLLLLGWVACLPGWNGAALVLFALGLGLSLAGIFMDREEC